MSMSIRVALALALDPSLLFHWRGWQADPWQRDLLSSTSRRLLLNCSRQAGKSSTVAALALHTALFTPGSLTLLLARAQRQSGELFRKVLEFLTVVQPKLGPFVQVRRRSALRLELDNGSRIVALPGQESTLRSYSGVSLLILDEAARVPEALYRSVRPMLAVSGGRLICLSTPFGRRGFFYDAWTDPTTAWQRIEVPATQVPRIQPEFLDEERRTLGSSWFNQEYACSFEALEGLVYPEFGRCLIHELPTLTGRRIGGIDFGFRNPFAAVWGIVDKDDVLWILGEHYAPRQTLREHALRLPRDVRWYADPAGAGEIVELRCAGFAISKGDNPLRAGIAAVTARIQTDRLKVYASACPRLIEEAGLYRYASADEPGGRGEEPVDEHNHALAALRYLVSKLDRRFFARERGASDPASRTP